MFLNSNFASLVAASSKKRARETEASGSTHSHITHSQHAPDIKRQKSLELSDQSISKPNDFSANSSRNARMPLLFLISLLIDSCLAPVTLDVANISKIIALDCEVRRLNCSDCVLICCFRWLVLALTALAAV